MPINWSMYQVTVGRRTFDVVAREGQAVSRHEVYDVRNPGRVVSRRTFAAVLAALPEGVVTVD